MHIFVFLCLAFLFGCFCGIKFATVTICAAIVFFSFAFGLKLLFFKVKTMSNLKALALLVVFCLGALMGIFYDHNTFRKVTPLYGTEISVTGRVVETDENVFLIDTEYGFLRVYNYTGNTVEKDYTVSVRGELSAYNVSAYHGGFDSRLYNARKGIVGVMNCDIVEITGYDKSFSMWNVGTTVREFIESKVEWFPGTNKVKGFVTALLTGNTGNLDSELKEAFRLAGISHLIAVSGLHVGIFLSFFWLFSRRLCRNPILHILFVLTLIIMYTLVIGERASVFRAGIMVVCSYTMFGFRRRSDSLMNLMIAGLLICFVNPYYVTDAGFQMSFLATLGIILFSEHFKMSIIAVPAIATLFLLPVTVYYYNTVSLETVLVNIITVPLVPSIILFGYIGCFLPFFPSVSCVVADFVISIAEFFASIDFLHISMPSPGVWHFIIWFLVICTAYNIVNRRQLEVILMLIALVLFFTVNIPYYYDIPDEAHRVRFINSGKYNMLHITTVNDYEILIDCGIYADDYALKNGTDTFYMVVISDDDESRYEGLETLCANKVVHNILLPDSMKDKNLNLENSRILYYNQYDYNFNIDGVWLKFTERNGERCFLMKLYDETVAMPFGTAISDIGNYNVICVPDKCTDCGLAAQNSRAEYYIHSTYRYKYYDYGNKYITSQVGMVEMLFFDHIWADLKVWR